ncbi:hypothetical protein Hanom_Chr04g00365901 [Helianthus anomalus]
MLRFSTGWSSGITDGFCGDWSILDYFRQNMRYEEHCFSLYRRKVNCSNHYPLF